MRAHPAGWPYQDPDNDDPDWTGGGDHPDWTAGDDGWTAGGATPGWPYSEDHPSWPAGSDLPDWPHGGGSAVPGREPPAMHRSVRLSEQILSEASSKAAGVRQEALDHANAIRQAAEREAEEIRRQAAYQADAAREAGWRAGEIRRQAAYQAEMMREAAVREADELRADAIRLSAELGQVAAYVTSALTMPGIPVPEPQAQPRQHAVAGFALPAAPAAEPGEAWPTRPAGKTTTWLPARPERRPAGPATGPARRTEEPRRSRQYRAMRAFAGTITALVVLALVTGAYQLATRGFTFFTFRSAGTGATDNNAVFPGVIPAPKPSPAHQHPTTGPGRHGARRTHPHVKGTAGRQSHG